MIKRNFFSILVALIILYLSMTGSGTFSKVHFFSFHNSDKVVHIIMYFGLMSVVLAEHRRAAGSFRQVLRLALFPALYGILIEIMQLFTVSRSCDIFDALADISGVAVSVLLWMLLKPFARLR